MYRFLQRSPVLHVAAVAAGYLTCPAAAPEQRPNILMIVTDDQGYGDLSINGNPDLHTPNMDSIGQRGVRFDRFYVSSTCAPSRASILTGRYNLRTGTHGVSGNRETIRLEEVTLAEALKTANYRTACFGKWHNGEYFPFTPTGQGFDEFIGFTKGHINNYFDPVLLHGTRPVKMKGYITDLLTDEALSFIERNRHQPFFCYLAYNAPHDPYQLPDRYFDKFKAKGFDGALAATWGMCENLDDNIGRLLSGLDQLGISGNTIVVFLTDNGGVEGAKVYNAGMRGWKTSVQEGGSRVPLFMLWPAANWTPHTVTQITAHIDLYPTLLDLCSVAPPPGPEVDGISLRPLLENADAPWQDRILFLHNPINESNRYPGAVRTQRYRLVREIPGPQGGTAAKANDAEAKPWQLYDMESDPGQKKNIAKEQPERVLELSRLYENWIDEVSAGLCRLPLPIGYDEQNPVELSADQAFFTEPLHYAAGRGFANDWLTGWTNVQGSLWFNISTARAGKYAVEIAFACPAEDAGSKIVVRNGACSVDAVIPPAPAVPVSLPHRDTRDIYKEREWAVLRIGTIDLPAGESRLTLESVTQPGSQVMDFKHLSLRYLP